MKFSPACPPPQTPLSHLLHVAHSSPTALIHPTHPFFFPAFSRSSLSPPSIYLLRPPSISKRGIWLSLDLILTFLFLISLLTSLLMPVLLGNDYGQARADYNSRLSTGLALSEQAYMGASFQLPTGGPQPFSVIGYFDPGQFPAFQRSLPPILQNWSILDSPPTTPSSSRVCVSRQMIDASSGLPHALWVCERR